ncbi:MULTISPECIES: nuclear transport factor 2 family protein [unclassified Acinetobacter]|uniref:nuclear transport factor 2 family protein n=1 Tax=unclassified Acinetobacter TaxID=196816 RepID=UPI002577F8EA|nr:MULTISPECIES: nuclear transport factor 2 family protein [unclassified Acinetobacter]MDM1757022.1 nuclear transport factor 2 family protein [Acinetobacter sp. 256-1]MDM1760196.1 nuclear transport factor 2 family protein [Acinetobacter sp. 251-1]
MSYTNTKNALQKWHDMIATRDMSILNELLADDVIFRSPVAFKPYEGKQVVYFILTNVIQVFENFTYHREFFTEDEQSVVLEFSAVVTEKQLKGIDMIRFNEHGQIVEFEVMIRSLSGLQALGAQMGERFAKYQPS